MTLCAACTRRSRPSGRAGSLVAGLPPRFVFAGSKSLPEDRLVDLNICSEALFIKRGKIKGEQKRAPAAEAAGQLLAGDPVLEAERTEIERLFKAYRLRNAEIHGGQPVQRTMTLLGGAKTEDLARFMEELARLLGRAIQLVLAELTRPQHEGHAPRSA